MQEIIAGLSADLSPLSVRQYVATLRQVLDFGDVDPNPARDRKVKLPRPVGTEVDPPSEAAVAAIIANAPSRWRLALRVLEQTGMRVGELGKLEWGDVDVAASRFRVRSGKTRAARRWVTVPEWVMLEVDATCPPDDRTPERRVFPGATRQTIGMAMRKACKAAGIAHYHPHSLRHRYASVKISEGVPATDLAAQLGHARKSLTLDTLFACARSGRLERHVWVRVSRPAVPDPERVLLDQTPVVRAEDGGDDQGDDDGRVDDCQDDADDEVIRPEDRRVASLSLRHRAQSLIASADCQAR